MIESCLIVGAGEAGVAAAGGLRANGFTGRIMLIGEERHHPYARPPLSKAMLTAAGTAAEPIRAAAWIAERGIEMRLGAKVTGADTSAQCVAIESEHGRETLAYDCLLLATGARVRHLPALDGLAGGAFYLRTHDHAIALRARLETAQSVAIVGGGVIGMEVASSARMLGCDVVVIEPADRLMARAMSECGSAELLRLHRDAGVDVRLQTALASVDPLATGGARLILTDGTAVHADLVIAAIGVDPDDDLARAIGCDADNGVLVDESCATSVANIFAAGDVANFPHPLFERRMRVEAWQHAGRHGAHAARAMLGDDAAYGEVPWFWTDQHGVNIQVAGVPVVADTHVRRGATTLHLRGDRLVAATTYDNARDMRPSINLIAAGWRGNPASLGDLSRPLASFGAKRPVPA